MSMMQRLNVPLLAAMALSSTASAAVLTGSYNPTPATGNTNVYNLTTIGGVDWTYWNTNANPITGVPDNEKLGGTAISAPTAVGGGALRGVGGGPYYVGFTDGTTPASTAGAAIANPMANTQLGTFGAGISMNITGDPAQTYRVTVLAGGFATIGTLTATLNGAAAYVQATEAYTTPSIKDSGVFTIDFSPDSASDLLNITFRSGTQISNASSHTFISAVAVGVVPEPATLGLAGLAGLGLLRRRRA